MESVANGEQGTGKRMVPSYDNKVAAWNGRRFAGVEQ
jgi:hypothetical protein